jgi:hypothetical protein
MSGNAVVGGDRLVLLVNTVLNNKAAMHKNSTNPPNTLYVIIVAGLTISSYLDVASEYVACPRSPKPVSIVFVKFRANGDNLVFTDGIDCAIGVEHHHNIFATKE